MASDSSETSLKLRVRQLQRKAISGADNAALDVVIAMVLQEIVDCEFDNENVYRAYIDSIQGFTPECPISVDGAGKSKQNDGFDREALTDLLWAVPVKKLCEWLRTECFINEAAILEASIGAMSAQSTEQVVVEGLEDATQSEATKRKKWGERLPRGRPRLAASKVATLTGFGHDFGASDIPQIFTEYLYQDNQDKFAADTVLLGLSVTTEEEELARIVAKLDASSAHEIIGNVTAASSAALQSRKDVQDIIDKNKAAVDKAFKKKQISRLDADTVRSAVQKNVSTSFGVRHEDSAVAKYEEITGNIVVASNSERYVLPLGIQDTKALDSAEGYIVGFVDGLSDKVDASDDDDWKNVPTVVEIKNRVGLKSKNRPPPFYDQIQCVIYMLMTQRRHCDLVEVFRDIPSQSTPCMPSKNTHTDGISMRITSIQLDGPPYHGDNWHHKIGPRCLELCRALLKVRNDDDLRYSWLYAVASGNEKEVWKILVDLLPYMKDVKPFYQS